ncbi:MAG: hypothetical protein ACLQVI_26685 [Polyangiaceae bacterium]
MRVAYFTAGTVGAGHHVRGLAVRRALARASFQGELRTFGPPLPYPGSHTASLAPQHELELDRVELSDPRRAPESELAHALRSFDPDLVLVDMFWAPVRFILPSLRAQAWLLVRKCPPVWFVGPNDAVRFDRSSFARVYAIEPGLEVGLESREIEPIVIANPGECRPPDALRRRFGVPSGAKLDVVVHAGRAGERARIEAGHDGARVLDLFGDDALFPAAEWLGGADTIACGAGYNSFWEARWLGYFGRTTFTPFERGIDDQAWRIRACSEHFMRENGADVLARAILDLEARPFA